MGVREVEYATGVLCCTCVVLSKGDGMRDRVSCMDWADLCLCVYPEALGQVKRPHTYRHVCFSYLAVLHGLDGVGQGGGLFQEAAVQGLQDVEEGGVEGAAVGEAEGVGGDDGGCVLQKGGARVCMCEREKGRGGCVSNFQCVGLQHTHTHAYMHTYTHVHPHECMCGGFAYMPSQTAGTYMCAYTIIPTHRHTRECARIYIDTHRHTHVATCMLINAHDCLYVWIRTRDDGHAEPDGGGGHHRGEHLLRLLVMKGRVLVVLLYRGRVEVLLLLLLYRGRGVVCEG